MLINHVLRESMSKESSPGVSTIGQVRTLDPHLPLVKPDGTLSLEQVDGTFQVETVAKVVAVVLGSPDQGMTPLEAVCCTYVSQQLFAGNEVTLTPDISDTILKAFEKRLAQGVLQPHALAIVMWIVRPEDDSLTLYRGAFESLYSDLDKKKAAAKKRIEILNEQSKAAREMLKNQNAPS